MPHARPPRTVLLQAALGLALLLGAGLSPDAAAAAATRGPIGTASFRQLNLLPYLHAGVRTYQASSADPTGKNDDGFTGKYSCLHRVPAGCLLVDHRGPGELESVWSPGPFFGNLAKDGRLTIELDGHAVVRAPAQSVVDGSLGAPFLPPVAMTLQQSPGGYSVNLPMPFRRRLRVIMQHNPGYWHVVYRAFSSARGVQTFRRRPDGLAAFLRRAGTGDPKPRVATATRARGFRVAAGGRALLATLRGSEAIRALRIRLTRYGTTPAKDDAAAAVDVLEHARLRISFDGRRTVDAPLGEFFGSGLGPARVRSLMFAMDPDPHGWLSSWWPMPFRSSAAIELVNRSRTPIRAGELEVTTAPSTRWRAALGPRGEAGYFHAWGHSGHTQRGRYWTFLSARGAGTFMGVTQTMRGANPPYYLEGNEQGFVDGARKPQLQGTGTEDFYLGGWYWYGRTYSLPLSGSPVLQTPADGCPSGQCRTAYRLMIADSVPFSRSILYRIEHGPENTAPAIYGSTAYWYQRR